MSGEIYPNQQLALVTLHVGFAGRFAALTRLDEFQDSLGGEFPRLYVPHVSDGEAVALKPYQLRSESGHEMLAVAVNALTYGAYVYPGSEKFLARAVPLLTQALSLFGVRDLHRVVYRYENQIGIQRVDGVLALDRVLNKERLAPMPLTQVRALNLEWLQATDNGELFTKIHVQNEDGVEVLHVDLAAAMIPGGDVSALLASAKSAHDVAAARFEAMISDDFRVLLETKIDSDNDNDEGTS